MKKKDKREKTHQTQSIWTQFRCILKTKERGNKKNGRRWGILIRAKYTMFNCPHNSAPKLIGLKKLPQLIGATSKEPTTMIKVGINNAKCNQRTTLTKHSYHWLISFLHSLPLSCFGFSSLSSSLFFYFLIVGREKGYKNWAGNKGKIECFFLNGIKLYIKILTSPEN